MVQFRYIKRFYFFYEVRTDPHCLVKSLAAFFFCKNHYFYNLSQSVPHFLCSETKTNVGKARFKTQRKKREFDLKIEKRFYLYWRKLCGVQHGNFQNFAVIQLCKVLYIHRLHRSEMQEITCL